MEKVTHKVCNRQGFVLKLPFHFTLVEKLTSELLGHAAFAVSENLLAMEYHANALGCVSTLGISDPSAYSCSASSEEGYWPPSH